MTTHAPLTGIVPAALLPMRPDFSIDWPALRAYIAWIAGQKPAAIAMNMDSSEVQSLTRDEQLEVIRVCREAVGAACPVYSGLFASCTDEAAAFAPKLRAAGAQGITVFPPLPVFLGQPLPTQMIYDYHKAIADAADLPIVAFQFPKVIGPDFPPETLAELIKLPQLVGIKDASYDATKTVDTIEAAAALPRKIGILTGSDSFILEAILMGCDGALIGFAGTAVAEQVEMHRAALRRDYDAAMAIWTRLRPLARFVFRNPNRDYKQRMKEILVMQGLFPGATVRRPLLPLGDAEREELRRLSVQAGILAARPAARAARA